MYLWLPRCTFWLCNSSQVHTLFTPSHLILTQVTRRGRKGYECDRQRCAKSAVICRTIFRSEGWSKISWTPFITVFLFFLPRVVRVRETRITSILAHIGIGLSIFMLPIPLTYIPRPVLTGLFVYMAVTSVSDNQLWERIQLVFIEQVRLNSVFLSKLKEYIFQSLYNVRFALGASTPQIKIERWPKTDYLGGKIMLGKILHC